jgi:hypothetical protein
MMAIGYNPHSVVEIRATIAGKGFRDFGNLLLRIIGHLLITKKRFAQSDARILTGKEV